MFSFLSLTPPSPHPLCPSSSSFFFYTPASFYKSSSPASSNTTKITKQKENKPPTNKNKAKLKKQMPCKKHSLGQYPKNNESTYINNKIKDFWKLKIVVEMMIGLPPTLRWLALALHSPFCYACLSAYSHFSGTFPWLYPLHTFSLQKLFPS